MLLKALFWAMALCAMMMAVHASPIEDEASPGALDGVGHQPYSVLQEKTMIILVGLPGSGKSTLAHGLVESDDVITAFLPYH